MLLGRELHFGYEEVMRMDIVDRRWLAEKTIELLEAIAAASEGNTPSTPGTIKI